MFHGKTICWLAAFGLIPVLRADAETVWQVDQKHCPSMGSGTASDPFCSIQRAIDTAKDGDIVVVAPGTYEESIVFRSPPKSLTVGAPGGPSQTSIIGSSQGPVVLFDRTRGFDSRLAGFHISNGQGGIQCFSSSPVIENCQIEGNSGGVGGGMTFLAGSQPTIRNCEIIGNTASTIGGGMYCASVSKPTIINCRIQSNLAKNGGGVYVDETSAPVILDSVIADNEAAGSGGGLTFSGRRSLGSTLERCEILGNRAVAAAGIDCYNSFVRIQDCRIEENVASEIGGGIICKASANPMVTNSVIRNNRAEKFNGGGVIVSQDSYPRFTDCQIIGNFARNGGGAYVYDNATPLFRRCLIADNVAEPSDGMHGYGGGLVLGGGSTSLDQCQILRNRADAAGGIGHGGPTGQIWNSVIQENMATRVGGGVLCNGSGLEIVNSLIALNTAGFSGGGIYNYAAGNPAISNSTIARNSAPGGGGLYAANASFPSLTSCILWGNNSNQILAEGDSNILARHSTIQAGWPGEANSSDSPRFRSISDFRLMPESPAIDAGVWEFKDEGGPPFRDLDGHARGLCHSVDRGAYEFGIGDFGCDRTVDLFDLPAWSKCMSGPGEYFPDPSCVAFDFEYDGDNDLTDVAAWQRAFANP